MDYPVLNKSPDVAQAVVPHAIDANGNAVPQGSSNPGAAETFPKPVIATATAVTRPANTTVYSAGDAVSNNATAASVTPISFAASDINNAPVEILGGRCFTTDTGPGAASAAFELYLFNADPTANSGVGAGDNAAWSQKLINCVGVLSGTFRASLDGSFAEFVPAGPAAVVTTPLSGGTTLYGLVKTLGAFTPSANSTTFTFTLVGEQGRA